MHKYVLCSLALTASFAASAALQLRGENMVYDTETNLTWVRSAGYAQGSEYDNGTSPSDGRLTYDAAVSWVSSLKIVYTETSALIGDWRLPAVNDLGAPGCDPAYTASAGVGVDCGYVGSGSGASELARLIHGSLNNPVQLQPTTVGPFAGIPSGFAWLGASYSPSANDTAGQSILTVEGWWVREPSAAWPPALVWGFDLSGGFQAPSNPSSEGYAWAVRTGDVTPIPEPSVALMLACGTAMLGLAGRKTIKQ